MSVVTRSFGKGESLLLIESIPLVSCSNCGERYFSARTMHEIERIKASRESISAVKGVSVAAFDTIVDGSDR